MLVNTDQKLKDMGIEPYGKRKLTAKQQRERIKNLTPGELWQMIQEHGEDEVNALLQKYWQEENYG